MATTIGSNPLTPDMAIEVYQNRQPQHVLIFDAKYRYERAGDGTYYPKSEDMDKMYRYWNGIEYKQYQEGTGRDYTIVPIVSSAYILYPGNKLHGKANNKVGGLPFTPGMAPQRLNEIQERVKDLLFQDRDCSTTPSSVGSAAF